MILNLSHPCNFGFFSGTRMLLRFLVKNLEKIILQTNMLRKEISIALISCLNRFFCFLINPLDFRVMRFHRLFELI